MPPIKSSGRRKTAQMAFCSIMTALAVAFMLLGGFVPVALYCIPMLSGLCLVPVLMEFGSASAWMTYLAVALLSLILDIDKEAAFFFIFIGYYPIIKLKIDRIQKRPLRIAVKIIFFSASICAMYVFLGAVLNMDAVVKDFQEMGKVMMITFVILFDVCFLIYDRLLIIASYIYYKRLHPRIRFL